MNIEKIVQKRAAEVGTQIVNAQRRLRALGEEHDGEAFLALCAEVAFRRGVVFTLKKMAKMLDSKDLLSALDSPTYLVLSDLGLEGKNER